MFKIDTHRKKEWYFTTILTIPKDLYVLQYLCARVNKRLKTHENVDTF